MVKMDWHFSAMKNAHLMAKPILSCGIFDSVLRYSGCGSIGEEVGQTKIFNIFIKYLDISFHFVVLFFLILSELLQQFLHSNIFSYYLLKKLKNNKIILVAALSPLMDHLDSQRHWNWTYHFSCPDRKHYSQISISERLTYDSTLSVCREDV